VKVLLTSYIPNPEQVIIEAAATCWKSVPREGILDHIIKAGHLTPTEFAVFNFRIEGVSRSLMAQLTRKRSGVAFAVESQRYVNYENGFTSIVPESIRSNFSLLNKYGDLIAKIANTYNDFIENDIPEEDARFILPNACTTTISMSINYHALIDLCRERLCGRAQWEIRELVVEIKKMVSEVSPKLASYLQPKCYWLKHCPEGKRCNNYAGIVQEVN